MAGDGEQGGPMARDEGLRCGELERQSLRRAVLDSLWEGTAPGRVPLLVSMGFRGPRFGDPGDMIAAQIEHIEEHSTIPDFYLPNLFPSRGIGVVAEVFGCKTVPKETGWDPWVEPLITSPADVRSLPTPQTRTNPVVLAVMAAIDHFQGNSTYPLRLCNVPSPMTTASYLWGYNEFLIALREAPWEVHRLLELVTEITIEFVRLQRDRIGKLFSLSHMEYYIPPTKGIRLSDDVLAVVSPEDYVRFHLPYNGRLGEVFGGVVLHSCGNIVHNLTAVQDTPFLTGICCSGRENALDALRSGISEEITVHLSHWHAKGEGLDAKKAYYDAVNGLFHGCRAFASIGGDCVEEARALAEYCCIF